jgi:hypothetical protein
MLLFVIVVSSLLILIGILCYGLFISIKKIDVYEQFIIDRKDEYNRLLYRLRELDQKEMFEKDDDVGIIFSQLKEEIEQFNKIIE